jgi:hypothetical protein
LFIHGFRLGVLHGLRAPEASRREPSLKPRVARNELLWGQIAAAKNPAAVSCKDTILEPRVARNELLWELIAAAKNPAGVLAILTPTRTVRRRSRSRFRVAVAFGALCPNRMFSQPSLVVCAMWAGTCGSTSILQGYNHEAQSCEERATLGADRGGNQPRRGFGNPHAHTQHSSQDGPPGRRATPAAGRGRAGTVGNPPSSRRCALCQEAVKRQNWRRCNPCWVDGAHCAGHPR